MSISKIKDQRYQVCFVCRKRFKETSKQDDRIIWMTSLKIDFAGEPHVDGFDGKWEFRTDLEIEPQYGAAMRLCFHEQCFLEIAGSDMDFWKTDFFDRRSVSEEY